MGTISKTASELDTLLGDIDGNVDTNFRIKDGVFQIKNTVDGKFHTVWIDAGGLKYAQTGEV